MSITIEGLAALLHDRYCQGGRCSRLDRRGCWAWTAGRWHRHAEEILEQMNGQAAATVLPPVGRDRNNNNDEARWAA